MKCFYYFKEKSRNQRSAPELKNDDSTALGRMIRSSCSTTSSRGITEIYEEKAKNLRVFSFSELRQATKDFSRLLKIGEGGFGCVYKGSIKAVDGEGDAVMVAIKKLNRDGLQGHKQWVAEMQFLGIVDHPNLVKLIGYCTADSERGIERLLVYEFMPNNSLEDHLFNKAYETLPWLTRLRILLGAAEGLAYLHEGVEVQVIHRDFKSSNVLLDEKFKAKISDFGLAREGPTADQTHVSTAVVGTHGYAAPDYVETGHLTSRSDVWSFGVVLYEVLTGRRSLEQNRPRGEQKLLEWVKQYPADNKGFTLIMDTKLESQYSVSAARKIAKLADRCLLKSGKERPKMSQVVQSLREVLETSGDRSPTERSFENESPIEAENKLNQTGASESWKRRMAHLSKLGEHVHESRRMRFLMMQMGKVQ